MRSNFAGDAKEHKLTTLAIKQINAIVIASSVAWLKFVHVQAEATFIAVEFMAARSKGRANIYKNNSLGISPTLASLSWGPRSCAHYRSLPTNSKVEAPFRAA